MLRFIKNSITKEYTVIRNDISSFSQNKISGIGAILSLLSFLAGIVCFAVILTKFYVADKTADELLDVSAFHGNASDFFHTPYAGILSGFSIALLIISYISYFKNEKKSMRILAIIPFAVILICQIIYWVMEIMYKRGIIENSDLTRNIGFVLIIVGFAAIIASGIILFMRERVISRSCLRMSMFSFVVLPLLTFCIENIVILAALLAFALFLFLFLKFSLSGNTSDESSKKKQKQSLDKPAKTQTGLTESQKQAINEINQKYRKGCEAIINANNENGVWMFSDKTNREIAQLRKNLEKEAALKGVQGKVSIYN